MNYNVAHSAPYPEIAVEKPDRAIAQLLTQDLAAEKSEMSSVNQYAYQQWVLRAKYPDLANTIAKIEVVERRHFHTIGQLIFLLGEDPKYQAIQQNRYIVWKGSMINYSKEVKLILQHDISIEQGAFEAYASQAKTVQDHKVSAVLARLSLDEKIHMDIFKDYLAKSDP